MAQNENWISWGCGTKFFAGHHNSSLKFQSPNFWGRRSNLGSRTQFEFSASQNKGAMTKNL